MAIKDKALNWWAESIKEGTHIVPGSQISNQRQRTFLTKGKFIYNIARGFWVLKRPEDDIEEMFPLLYWEIIDAVLKRYAWSVSGISAVEILNGEQSAQKELIVSTREKTNWKLPLITRFSISIVYEPHYAERLIKKVKIASSDIPVDIPEKVLIDVNKIETREVKNFVAGTDFDLRKLEILYQENPKPFAFRRLQSLAKAVGRLDLVIGLEQIIETHTHYQVGKKEKIDLELVAKQPLRINPAWVVRQETQIQEFEKVLRKLSSRISKVEKYPLSKLLAQAREHKKYDTYHSTTLEGYQVTPEEVDALLSGIIPRETKEKSEAYIEKIKNRMAILGYSKAFDFIIRKAQTDFNRPTVNQKLVKDIYFQLFKPSADAKIINAWELSEYRNIPAYIRGTRYVPPSYEKLSELMESYAQSINKIKNPVIKAILAHFFFVTIHPYGDGNGRTARLLMNYLFLTSGYPWITIRADQRNEYFDALREGQTSGNILPFGKFITSMLKSVKLK